MVTSAQQAELHAPTQADTLAEAKLPILILTVDMLSAAHDFAMLRKQHGFLTFSRNKIKNGPYIQKLLNVIL